MAQAIAKTFDTPVRILQINDAVSFWAVPMDETLGLEEAFIVSHTKESRIKRPLFEQAIAQAGVGGVVLLDQLNPSTGSVGYVTKIKTHTENKRAILSPAMTIELIANLSSGNQSYQERIQNTDMLLRCGHAVGSITVLSTMTKGFVEIANTVDAITEHMIAVFDGIKCNSYTPKLVVARKQDEQVIEIYGSRDANGNLNKEATVDFIHQHPNLPIFIDQAGGEVLVLKGVVLRLSNMSAAAIINRMLKATRGNGGNSVVDRFFSNSILNGNSLFGTGLTASAVENGYEYGTYARLLTQGVRVNQLKISDGIE